MARGLDMSLLNNALRDLEQRQRAEQGGVPVSPQLASNRGRGGRMNRILVALIVVLLVAVALLLLLRRSNDRPPVAESALAAPVPAQVAVKPAPANGPEILANAPAPKANETHAKVSAPSRAKAVAPAESSVQPRRVTVAPAVAPKSAQETVARTAKATPEKHQVAPAARPLPVAKAQATAQKPAPTPTQAAQPAPAADPATAASRVVEPATLTPSERDSQLADKLRRLLDRGDANRAAALFQAQATVSQAWSRSRVALVSGLLARGQNALAQDFLPRNLVEQSPALRLLESRRLLVTEGAPAALALLQSQIPDVAEWPDYHATLATLLQQTGQHARAAEVWAALLQLDSARADWWTGLGIALEGAGRSSDARRAYRQALSLPGLNEALQGFVVKRLEQMPSGANG